LDVHSKLKVFLKVLKNSELYSPKQEINLLRVANLHVRH
jgi:hypothetical protein